MKIIVLGDTHGRTTWKEIIEKEKDYDKLIFLGDYFDTKEQISQKDQLSNFLEILQLKSAQPDKVILLLGNHDFHYIPGIDEHYSGYNPTLAVEIGMSLKSAIDNDLVQICHQEKIGLRTYFFSHAGLTNTWLNSTNYSESIFLFPKYLNDLIKYKPFLFKFRIGRNFSNTGDDITQGPLWVRIPSLVKDQYKGDDPNFIQIIGHTSMKTISFLDNVVMIDTLGSEKSYLCITQTIAEKRIL